MYVNISNIPQDPELHWNDPIQLERHLADEQTWILFVKRRQGYKCKTPASGSDSELDVCIAVEVIYRGIQ